MRADPLLRRLQDLDTAQLAELLRRRPDVAPPRAEPQDLSELAEHLQHPASLARVLQHRSLPAWQLVEAALALGGRPTLAELGTFLDTADHHPVVDDLEQLAVLARDGDRLYLPDTLRRLFPTPLGLGAPLAELLTRVNADAMRGIARTLGLARPKTRHDAEQALLAFFADPANILQVMAGLPAEVRALLLRHATDTSAADVDNPDEFDDDPYDDDLYDPDVDPDNTNPYDLDPYDPDAYRVRQDALRRAGQYGLLIDVGYGYDWRMPAEVTLALRGPDYRAPFAAQPPFVAQPVDAERVDRSADAAAAAGDFLATLLAVLDHLARHPLPVLKSGGVGARELTKLIKTLATGEPVLRLVLELAGVLGLLDPLGVDVRPCDTFAAWRDAPPAEQFAAAVEAWWTLGHVPTQAHDAAGKAQRVLVGDGRVCELCVLARHTMLDVLQDTNATDRADVAACAHWRRPAAHLVAAGEPLAECWREAELLGVVAGGVLSPLGRALLEHADVRAAAAALLPAATEQATFGSDLTVFVAGFPGARVSAVLDSAADREGRGGAVTWRFTPGSVRRAFDDGATADTLLAELAAVSVAELPQPLRYLITDIARQHGTLRLSAATSVVCSDDAALLALVAADRKLAKHGLRLLAPTVLAADVPVATLLAAIRAAGYFPVLDGPQHQASEQNGRRAAGVARSQQLRALLRAAQSPTPEQPEQPEKQQRDWHAVAARIEAGRPTPVSSTTEKVLSRLNRTLSIAEVRQLARAIDRRGRIGIDYVAASGRGTQRVIAEPELLGPALLAWCELRQDQREFTVARIVSVQAV